MYMVNFLTSGNTNKKIKIILNNEITVKIRSEIRRTLKLRAKLVKMHHS